MRAFITLIRASWRYTQGRHHWVLFYIAVSVVANALVLLQPIVVGRLLNDIQNIATLADPIRTIIDFGLLLLGIQAVFWLLHGPSRVLEATIAFHARNSFADVLFRKLTRLPVQWHRDHHSGETINRMRKATKALQDFTADGYLLIHMLCEVVGSIVALAILFPAGSALAALFCAVAIAVILFFDRVLIPQYQAINEREHHVASAAHDYITNIFTVISLRLEELTRTEHWRRMTSFLPLVVRNNVINELKWCAVWMIVTLMIVTVVGWYTLGIAQGAGVVLVGTLYMLYDYPRRIGDTFFTFAGAYGVIIQRYADLQAVQEILDTSPAHRGDVGALPKEWKSLDIHVSAFSYEDAEHRRHQLNDVSIRLTRGKRIALVGESGSGKSTLMCLLRGLYSSDLATVTCDGQALPYGLDHLVDHVTLIPQEPEIFANTVGYNVSVDTELPQDEVLRDIELACFTPVLRRLPKGLDTDISEKSVNLSGGEKQRLALARGIFAAKDSDILLLDEPTSSVDPGNELQIHRNLFGHFERHCIVASIHRLHLLPLFDEVIVLDQGRVVEAGTPAALMAGTGPLASMWQNYKDTQ